MTALAACLIALGCAAQPTPDHEHARCVIAHADRHVVRVPGLPR